MYLLNYLYFLILTYVGVKYLFSNRVKMKHPLQKGGYMVLDGREAFWVLTFSTGLLAFSAPGALDLMAIRLLVLEILLMTGLFMSGRSPVWSAFLICYAVFLGWLIIGCFYSFAPMYGVRVVLKYIYPFIIVLFASAVVRDFDIFIKSSLGARQVAVLSIIIFFTPLHRLFNGVFWYGTAAAINYISMMIFSLALYCYARERKKNLRYVLLFILPCFLWVFRTSIMGTALAIMTFLFFRYRLKSLPLLFGSVILFVVAIFFIPSVRSKMFYDDSTSLSQLQNGEISKDNIDSNGRFTMWEWSMDRYYKDRELVGSGTGTLQEAFYSLRHPFGTIRIVHCDYVQMLCDNGLIGIVLFGLSFLFMIFHCFSVFQNRRNNMGIRVCAIIAGASIPGVLLTMMTDNVINYSMATISYPCGFYGMMLGMLRKQKYQK